MLIIYGMPDDYPKWKRDKLWGRFCGALQGIHTPRLEPDDISAFFPRDQVQTGLGEETVIVEVLLEERGWDEIGMKEAVAAIGKVAKSVFPKACVKVFLRSVQSFWNSKEHFWTPEGREVDEGHIIGLIREEYSARYATDTEKHQTILGDLVRKYGRELIEGAIRPVTHANRFGGQRKMDSYFKSLR